MHLFKGWEEKENGGRKRINSDNPGDHAPRISRNRLWSDCGRPAFSDLSNNYRLQNYPNQDYRFGGEKSNVEVSKRTNANGASFEDSAYRSNSDVDNTISTSEIDDHNVSYAARQFLRKTVIPPRVKISTAEIAASSNSRRHPQGMEISPIQSSQFRGAHSHLRIDIKPQKKTTLVRKSARISKYNESAPYCLDIFTTEYIDDIILNLLMVEHKFKLKSNFYLENNPCLDDRTRILNWLISMQGELLITNAMYYSTVYLFDVILSQKQIPKNKYQLVMVAITWLITKYSGTKMLSAPKLVRLCDNDYSQRQLLFVELKMLNIFKFNFRTPDLILFVNYYLHKLNIPLDHPIAYMTNYIMESFTLSPQYSTYESSMVAAAALYLSTSHFYPGLEVYQRIESIRGYHSPSKLEGLVKIMFQHLKNITSNHYVKVIYTKYCTRETKFASMKFSKFT